MTKVLSGGADRVRNALIQMGFTAEILEMPGSTRTAQEAADSLGCSVSQIAKSLIFKEGRSGRAILVIASGSNRVDTDKIKRKTGLALVKADGKFVKSQVGFAIGGVPPLGHSQPLETLLDKDLQQYETIWAAAGTPSSLFSLQPEDLQTMTHGRWTDLSENKQ